MQYNDFPPQVSHFKTPKQFFDTSNGCLAYERWGSYAVVAGEPICANPEQKSLVLDSFFNHCESESLKPCGYYVSQDFYHKQIRRVPVGTSSLVDLEQMSTHGKSAREIRRALNLKDHASIQLVELTGENVKSHESQINELYRYWKTKRAPYFRLGFFISHPSRSIPMVAQKMERVFLSYHQDVLGAMISILPYRSKGRKCAYVDALIQNPKGNKQCLDHLLVHTAFQLKAEGYHRLSLGLNAFRNCSFGHLHEIPFALFYFLGWPYPAKNIHFFKNKFKWSYSEPRYFWYHSSCSYLRSLVASAGVTLRESSIGI